MDESGKVLYDNEADVENMENHGHRKEIREAELNGEGEDERMSSTLSEKTMYYAAAPGQWQCSSCLQHPEISF